MPQRLHFLGGTQPLRIPRRSHASRAGQRLCRCRPRSALRATTIAPATSRPKATAPQEQLALQEAVAHAVEEDSDESHRQLAAMEENAHERFDDLEEKVEETLPTGERRRRAPEAHLAWYLSDPPPRESARLREVRRRSSPRRRSPRSRSVARSTE